MEILRKLSVFNPPINDMKTIYISYIRSILEQSCAIWHSSLSEEDNMALERVQKNAFRIILKSKYFSYEQALYDLSLDSLYQQREKLLYQYGRQCLMLKETKYLFPLRTNVHTMNNRKSEKYEVLFAHTERLRKSTVPYIQRMLNKYES